MTTGFWFSLGHSSLVFALTVLLVRGCTRWPTPCRTRTQPRCRRSAWSGRWSQAPSSPHPNSHLVAVVGIAKVARRMRHGHFNDAESNTTCTNAVC
ncbi:hypothetical protein [Pseudonocardia sp. N23]|uniref:hypothetical protein n=1 Tax=Pseudonocardia sp. N23 TaxID=1987376 RepID=UPI00278BAE9F|nr:hypothetical protein [Pseudonocardia sp. N23]